MRLLKRNTSGSINLHFVNKRLSVTITQTDNETVAFELSDFDEIRKLTKFFELGENKVELNADTATFMLYRKVDTLSAFDVGIYIFDIDVFITDYLIGLRLE